MWLLWILSIIAGIVLLIKLYQRLTTRLCRSSAHMVGKVVIVTGGNSGIGLETAKDLAFRGAKVIIACRSVRRGEAAQDEIIKATGNPEVYQKQLDLASFKSIRKFCDDIIKNENRLDVLINNAAAGGLGNYKTEDGLHVGMQVNYFGPFILTLLLMPLLKKTASSRIVNVSSNIHFFGELDFENLNMEKYWSDYLVYANSKLFLNLMTLELSERLKDASVTVNALHPGIAATNLFRNLPSAILRNILSKCIGFMYQSIWEAAQTSIYLSVSPDVNGISGKYFTNCNESKPSAVSKNREASKRLFEESERLVKVSLTR